MICPYRPVYTVDKPRHVLVKLLPIYVWWTTSVSQLGYLSNTNTNYGNCSLHFITLVWVLVKKMLQLSHSTYWIWIIQRSLMVWLISPPPWISSPFWNQKRNLPSLGSDKFTCDRPPRCAWFIWICIKGFQQDQRWKPCQQQGRYWHVTWPSSPVAFKSIAPTLTHQKSWPKRVVEWVALLQCDTWKFLENWWDYFSWIFVKQWF